MDFSQNASEIITELSRLRSARNLSYQAVADACEVSQTTIIRVFNGETEPSYALLQKIAAAVQYKPERKETNNDKEKVQEESEWAGVSHKETGKPLKAVGSPKSRGVYRCLCHKIRGRTSPCKAGRYTYHRKSQYDIQASVREVETRTPAEHHRQGDGGIYKRIQALYATV